MTEIFPVNSVGIVTARDAFAIDSDKEALKRRVRQFRDKNLTDEFIRQTYGLRDTSKFKLKAAREKIMKDADWEDSIIKILYRPFDAQWIFYNDELVERTLKKTMRHMMRENLGLLTCRQQSIKGFHHVFICDKIVESCAVSNKTTENKLPLPSLSLRRRQSVGFPLSKSGAKGASRKVWLRHDVAL